MYNYKQYIKLYPVDPTHVKYVQLCLRYAAQKSLYQTLRQLRIILQVSGND